MREPARIYEKIGELKTTIRSATSTRAKSPEEALDTLDKLDRLEIESFVTKEGDLWIRHWTIKAEDFVSPEHAAVVRSKRPSQEGTDKLAWLSKNLTLIRSQYGGQWVAVYSNAVVAAAPDLSDLMNQIAEYDRPLITFIPAEPVVWTFTYANQKL
ncbi:MAG: hypothetical protein A2V87_10735 [Deltaproteobacteria bacterium RBG_16_58_17]|nr:MAG: hypothetical protein A2V87_10735 [Deltaproteobacteria bacterium RBG_16_58_17]OHE19088.1 MAG: hypothetical protein A2X96_07375 [Syntrophobacterales bacterium GWC2_56_13]OHE20505.1 MAG: hypothetical protein A2X95_00415 [Syntrophobacterales bacterium GWF2_56_9]